MTTTASGYEFQWLVILNKFLDGFLPGLGFTMGVALVYFLALWLSRKPKPIPRKVRVKLIRKEVGHGRQAR
ncbi:hypothetical protein [Alcaligenes faecalis]|uniref:hypothetical protein n=1 Tax=Alcaligenes faecalis TaxID=511 RepID=UPI001C9AFAB9|nr:hypothetical protein [Alcaligenes faecalis]MBY6308680.1 hypothetical protein [Alcaligenes faecalis]MBY6316491.1 hypothetical protein [Alcaligenes faecalis]